MSTTSQPTVSTVLRFQKDGTRIPISCPLSIIVYNMFMGVGGGGRRGDQVHCYYSCRTKCRKFYIYVFHFLLDVSIANPFILLKHYCRDSPHITILEFCLQLAKELIGDDYSRRRPGHSAGLIHSLPLRHFPVIIPVDGPTQKAKHKRRGCACCLDKKKMHVDNSWYCPECNVWLCHT